MLFKIVKLPIIAFTLLLSLVFLLGQADLLDIQQPLKTVWEKECVWTKVEPTYIELNCGEKSFVYYIDTELAYAGFGNSDIKIICRKSVGTIISTENRKCWVNYK